jgi:hypothetical protein
MPQLNDLSRSLVVLEQDATLIAVIEVGQSNWLVAGIVPGVERSPLKKLAVDESLSRTPFGGWRCLPGPVGGGRGVRSRRHGLLPRAMRAARQCLWRLAREGAIPEGIVLRPAL